MVQFGNIPNVLIDRLFTLANQLVVSAQQNVDRLKDGNLALNQLIALVDRLTPLAPIGLGRIEKDLVNITDGLLASSQRRLNATQNFLKNITNLIVELTPMNGTLVIPTDLDQRISVIVNELVKGLRVDPEELNGPLSILNGLRDSLIGSTSMTIRNLGTSLINIVNQLLLNSQRGINSTEDLLKNITDLIDELTPMNGKITIPINLVDRLFPLGG